MLRFRSTFTWRVMAFLIMSVRAIAFRDDLSAAQYALDRELRTNLIATYNLIFLPADYGIQTLALLGA